MASVYERRDSRKLWCAYFDASGVRRQVATPYAKGQEDLAQRFADELERQAKRGSDPETGTFTFRLYAKQWIEGRRARGIDCAADDEARIAKYATLALGSLKMSEIRPRHIRDLVLALKAKVGPKKEQLAPRTVRHIFGTLHTLFADAVVDELVVANPCVVKRGDLPKKIDKDPAWRSAAVFTRAEVELIISSEKIPEDRRVLYALLFLTGTRFGEAAALRWSSYDPARRPLSHLLVARSFNVHKHTEKAVKTEITREVPVHPTLARILARWRLSGWQRMLDRKPEDDDLIIPSREGRHRNANLGLKRFHQDLEALGLRKRRQHDARRTFITLARTDGARADILEAITHGPRGDIINVYTTLPWELLCAEVEKLQIRERSGELIAMPKAVGARESATSLLRSAHRSGMFDEKWRGGRDSNPRPPA